MNTCDKCFHHIDNELGCWCLRYHVYTFPQHGQGKNCSEWKEEDDVSRKLVVSGIG